MNRAGVLVASIAVVAACGDSSHKRPRVVGSQSTYVEAVPTPSQPGRSMPGMRALLKRYSEVSANILARYESLPTRWRFGGRNAVTLTRSDRFGKYFRDRKPENLVRYMSIAVHETYHGYANLMSLQLFADTRTPYGKGGTSVQVGGEPMLVTYTVTFPVRDMIPTFPAAARTKRYEVYISKTPANQSTQTVGVYGLLDEWAAYYQTALVRMNLWPWVRDESLATRQLLGDFVGGLHSSWVPYAEFKLFILHYLHHARAHRPDVYRAVMGNERFRRAFVACDEAYRALLGRVAQLEPTVHAFARSKKLDARLLDGRLMIHGRPSRVRDPAYPELVRLLGTERYRRVARELSR